MTITLSMVRLYRKKSSVPSLRCMVSLLTYCAHVVMKAYALFRIDGLEMRTIDYVVPGAIPFEFGGTYERIVEINENELYAWVLYDSTGDGLSLDSGGGM